MARPANLGEQILQTLTQADLLHLQYGATLLASGGGGGFATTGQVMASIVALMNTQQKAVRLTGVDALADTDYGFDIAAIGKPSQSHYDHFEGSIKRVAQTYQKATGQTKIDFMMCGETGANTFMAMLASLVLDVPMVDGDSAGRAIPTLGGSLYTANGLPFSPAAIANVPPPNSPYGDHEAVITGKTVDQLSDSLRQAITTPAYGGGVATFATWGGSGADLKLRGAYVGQPSQPNKPYATVCAGSVSFAIALGAAIKGYLDRTPVVGRIISDLMDEINMVFGNGQTPKDPPAKVIIQGAIKAIKHPSNSPTGFDYGTMHISANPGWAPQDIEVRFMNENIMAFDMATQQPIVMYPDIIGYLDDTFTPTTNSDGLKVGDQLTLIQIPARLTFKHGTNAQERTNLDDAAQAVRKTMKYTGRYLPVAPTHFHYPGE